MKTIKKLKVRASYTNILTNIEVPDAVYDQLVEWCGGDPIDDVSFDATEAYYWLIENINEINATDLQVEVKGIA